ncbi:Protein of unknown function DUF4228 [Cynara cardunculus var. scolymus]|uniref:Uncharacterized protein n=1 Tax=Cynara cardunculus var. scolymus TaxID=59895 RepID=A0A103XLV7_CYNCS|nr:Protein of unknown function DUF4228 [Cynara cardunculus var. scolymus]
MILKLFGSRNINVPQNPNPNPGFNGVAVGEKPLILQIIHAGGKIERYYMAFPAAWIMDKYPNFVLARPEIFRRPWDSVVRPEEMLVPGQKYFVVPIRTVKKLHRRIWKPSIEITNALVCQDKDTASSKPKPGNRCVRFRGIESKTRNDLGVAEDNVKKSLNGKGLRKKKNVRFSPSLTMIDETQDFQD